MSYNHVTRRKCEQCGLHHNATLQGCRQPVVNTAGYRMVFRAPGRYVLEHRVMMETYLERTLSGDEVVHHRNQVKDDNRLENLQLMTQMEHFYEHSLESR